jgi:two-component system nitrogen regulation sensor histidine kinase GlnL
MNQPSFNLPADVERRIVENLSSAILLLDTELRVEYVNPTTENLFALSRRQLLGQPMESLLRCPEVSIAEHMRQALGWNQPTTEREIALIFPDGRTMIVDCALVPLHDFAPSPRLLVEIQRLDHLRRISREEQLLNQQEVTRDVIRGLAHEIKNPLGGLRGAAQLLESELDDRELREYTQIIVNEADRLQNLVDRMFGPNRPPEMCPIDIHEVLERVRSLVQAEVGERIDLVRDYDPSIPELKADADQLIQALLNIVRNAARAVGDQDGRILLRTRVQRQYTLVNERHRLVAQIDIVDNGPGIPDEVREKLFFPMVTHGTGGMGMGLAIAQSLINQHKGLIECQSRPGETVFSVFLPLNSTSRDAG